jgi:CO/xanthine dehydrogenase Mo-binding subunit
MMSSVNRRNFLKIAGGAGAGLVLSFYLPSKSHELFGESPNETFAPNVWLRIDPSGTVTITVAKSEMGQGPHTYFPMIVAEELEADLKSIRVEQADAHPDKYGSQGTGGSTGVRTSWEKLRKAGAAAREMLISAAATKWNVDRTSCYAEHGSVIHKPTKRTFTYGQLAVDASKLPVPQNPPVKDPKDFKIVGTWVAQLPTTDRSTGKAMYGTDTKVPGMLYASLVRCRVFGGNVASFDATKAKTVPGVRTVVQIDNGVAVLADSTWAAMQGRDALDIKWDNGPNSSLNSEKIRQMFEEYSSKEGIEGERTGDIAKALSEAAKTVDAVYDLPYVSHSPLEPMNCLANVKPGSCEIWVPSQTPQSAQDIGAQITGFPKEKVVVHVTMLGGGFGRRLDNDYVEEAVKISKAAGVPVQLLWTREDDMMHDLYRPASRHLVRGAIDRNGNLVGWDYKMVGPSIGGQRSPERYKDGMDRSALSAAIDLPYTIPNLLVRYVMANTAVPIGAWRSVYASQNVFVVESFIDELSHLAGKDPVEFRLSMMDKSPRLKKLVETVAEKAGWKKPLPKGHGLGIACSSCFGSHAAEVAEVSVENGAVKVHRFVVAVDCGIAVAPNTLEAQLEGAVALALTAALKDEITIKDGRTTQSNFDAYRLLTIGEMPKVEVHIINSYEALGGIGEPALPPVAPALCNAIFSATGKRIRRLPITKLV